MGTSWSNEKSDKSTRTYGWKRDLPDKRDSYHSFRNVVTQNLSKKVDLRKTCPKIYNQGKLGSCTANAIAAAYEFDEILQAVGDGGISGTITPSRLFIYYNEREMEGHVEADSGAMIRDGIKSINKQGVCSEVSWPYDVTCFTKKPSRKCYQEALNHRAIRYRRVPHGVTAMKACLNSGLPFVFGFSVYESFESKEIEETGIMSMPKADERQLGGHAVMAVGYCEAKQCMIIRNSWGEEWGEGGYFYMPYRFIRDPDYCSDFWTIRKVHDVACSTEDKDDGDEKEEENEEKGIVIDVTTELDITNAANTANAAAKAAASAATTAVIAAATAIGVADKSLKELKEKRE